MEENSQSLPLSFQKLSLKKSTKQAPVEEEKMKIFQLSRFLKLSQKNSQGKLQVHCYLKMKLLMTSIQIPISLKERESLTLRWFENSKLSS